MVMPGVTIRNPRENRLEFGERTALTVCQAISIAITVVLPEPVAIFMARRNRSGLASAFDASRCFQMWAYWRRLRATSVSQMMVSTASIWQKNGRSASSGGFRQYSSSRAVDGVTPQSAGFGIARHVTRCWRISSTMRATP